MYHLEDFNLCLLLHHEIVEKYKVKRVQLRAQCRRGESKTCYFTTAIEVAHSKLQPLPLQSIIYILFTF